MLYLNREAYLFLRRISQKACHLDSLDLKYLTEEDEFSLRELYKKGLVDLDYKTRGDIRVLSDVYISDAGMDAIANSQVVL